MIEIKTLPIPPTHNRKKSGFPVNDLKVGQCFDVPQKVVGSARAAAIRMKNTIPGWDYTTRTLPDGTVRIWRTA
ncbi:MAG TPA: hypothetical protein PK231_03080 [Acidocella sp.]|nr:hypothetical protein [Acidocella sp.]